MSKHKRKWCTMPTAIMQRQEAATWIQNSEPQLKN